MPSQSRRKSLSVIQQFAESPQQFDFFQAVRLLENAALSNPETRHLKPVAGFVPPTAEVARFQTYQSLNFPAAEIQRAESDDEHWKLYVNFLGLTGAMGVLPFHYSELILQRLKIRDKSLADFLDLFNHRTLSLFYKAATKYHLPVDYERSKRQTVAKPVADNATQSILSLIGLGTSHLTQRQYTSDESLLYYAGLFTQQVRSASGLKQILEQHFRIPVKIQQFIGQWQELIDDVRTMLPSRTQPKGRNVCLGRSVMLGRKGWYAQAKFHIVLGPLNREQLKRFSPGTQALRAISEIVQFYVGMENDYDFIIRIKRSDIPDKIVMSKTNPPIMGWNTWLSSKPGRHYHRDESLDITLSANRFK